MSCAYAAFVPVVETENKLSNKCNNAGEKVLQKEIQGAKIENNFFLFEERMAYRLEKAFLRW